MNEHEALERAIRVAIDSPCAKSKRGVVIFRRTGELCGLIAKGANHPPAPFQCDGSESCRASCGKVCTHAEMDAILAAVAHGHRIKGASMLHVKVVNGEAVASGPPSCWQCSRHILRAGIAEMWLLHDDGLRRYFPEEFHRLTLEHCGLHTGGV